MLMNMFLLSDPWSPRSGLTSAHQAQQDLINCAALEMVSQHGFRKEDGRIMVQDPQCPHNYVPVTRQINHQPQPLKVMDLVLQLENDNDEVGALIRAEPSLRKSTEAYLSADIAVFPELRRDPSLYG